MAYGVEAFRIIPYSFNNVTICLKNVEWLHKYIFALAVKKGYVIIFIFWHHNLV